jgi:hypothetical protein
MGSYGASMDAAARHSGGSVRAESKDRDRGSRSVYGGSGGRLAGIGTGSPGGSMIYSPAVTVDSPSALNTDYALPVQHAGQRGPGGGGGGYGNASNANSAPEEQSSAAPVKCTNVFLGFSSANDTGARRRACAKLRCLDCDFEVVRFEDAVWDHDAVDYMFFRNVVPDRAKLAARIVRTPRACCYCCQCSWVSIVQRFDGQLVCARKGPAATPLPRPSAAAAAAPARSGGAAEGKGNEDDEDDDDEHGGKRSDSDSKSSGAGARKAPFAGAGAGPSPNRASLGDRVGGNGWLYWTCAGHQS